MSVTPSTDRQPSRLKRASPDDLRAEGWEVAVHNDYRLGGQHYTFWLLTRARPGNHDVGQFVKGEGATDQEALDHIRWLIATQFSG